MQKTLIATAVALALPGLALAADAAPAAPASPHTITYNVGVVSDYLFRGVSQTHGGAAIQGGVDYSHSSGLYAGAFVSSITWVKDFLGKGRTEVDFYGGYKNTFAGGDWNYDVGVITYQYPSKGSAIPTILANPNTTEVYGAIGYKWVSVKYSQAVSKNFIGWYGGPALDKDTRGSNYLEVNANYDLGDGWAISGHMGTQKVKNSVETPAGVKSANYTDYKIGVTKDLGYGVVGLAYSATNTDGTCTATGGTSSYCWANGNFVAGTGPTTGFTNVAKSKLVLSFNKSF